MKPPRHPRQPLIVDDTGVVRFKQNRIVYALLNRCRDAGFGLNEIVREGFDADDYDQFMQLIGYSVSGYGELSSSPKDAVRRADKKAAVLLETMRKEQP